MTHQKIVQKFGNGMTTGLIMLVVSNAVWFGAVLPAFAQSAPYAHTQPAGPIATTNATLNGMVVPNGTSTVAWFEWGTNGLYSEATAPVSVGNGTMVVPCSATASNLLLGMLYQCRLVASNDLGVAIGAPRLFAANGDAIAWGTNSFEQTDVYPDGNTDLGISAGSRHTLTLTKDGRVRLSGSGVISYQSVPNYAPAGVSNVVAIASGIGFCLAVRSDGTVAAWGASAFATNVPPGLSNVVAVAGGQDHSLALRSDGTVIAWGSNTYGRTNIPAGLSNVVAIAASPNYNLALRADGTIACWGQRSDILAGISNATAIAAGSSSAYAVKSDGTATNWNLYPPPAGLSNVVTIAAGGYHSLALRSDGSVVAWGQNTVGQANVPLTASNCVAIAAGEQHSVAISAQLAGPRAAIPWANQITATSAELGGFVAPNGLPSVAWFEWGDVGGDWTYSTTPTNVGDSIHIVPVRTAISSLTDGGRYQCRLVVSNEVRTVRSWERRFTTGSKLTAWGYDYQGQGSTRVPAGLTNVVAMDGARGHVIALRNDGTVVSWGLNDYGQANVPNGLVDIVDVSASGWHSLALKLDGTVVAWGRNESGATTVPEGLSNVVQVVAGGWHSAALKADGSVVVWGGLVGWGGYAEVTRYQPTGLKDVIAISTSGDHMLALRQDGMIFSWGSLSFIYTMEVPSSASNVVAISAGGGHNLALRNDGRVVRWGGLRAAPPPAGLTNAIGVAAGWDHSLALRSDGSVTVWMPPGYVDYFGRTNVPPGLSNVVAVASGEEFILALGSDVPPIALGMTNNGFVNADLRISLPARDPNGDPLTYRIATLPTVGALYQYDAGVRGAAITAPDTAVTDPEGRVVFAPATDGVGTPYATFSYLVNDGLADSPPATVTVNIALPPAPSMAGTNSNWSLNLDGAFALTFTGNSNAAYSVYGSTNLIHWERLGAAMPLSNGWFQFLDVWTTNWPQRYYRAGAP